MATAAIDTSLSLSARAAATAWLNASLASSTDESRPVLYKTICLELHAHGVQMIATNGHALVRTWTPVSEDVPWPDLHMLPRRTIVVTDPDGFGKAFMGALLRAAADDDHGIERLLIDTAFADDPAEPTLGAEFVAERVELRAYGQSIHLRLFDGPYPNWRGLKLGADDVERVDGLTVAPKLLALVGKLKGVSAVDLEFTGATTHVAFVARGATEVRGLFMPMLRPEAEKPADDEEAED